VVEGPSEVQATSPKYDTVIEVLDLVDYTVVYRRRFDDPVIGSVCPTGELVVAGVEGGSRRLRW
jgi:hypothetical protein